MIGRFQRRAEAEEARGFSRRGEHPLIESTADAAALDTVFEDDEAHEAACGSEASAHGMDAGEHAIEGKGHVVVFGKLEDGEHAAGGSRFRRGWASALSVSGQSCDFGG